MHVGSAQSGHYYSFVKLPSNDTSKKIGDLFGCTNSRELNGSALDQGMWYRCDDHNTSTVPNFADVLEKECFGGGK